MKYYLALTLLSSLLLTSCSVDWNNQKESNDLFKKKVECGRKEYIEQLNTKDIFYSPSLNTCIMGIVGDNNQYKIIDFLTKHFITSNGKDWTKEEYDKKIKELRGEL